MGLSCAGGVCPRLGWTALLRGSCSSQGADDGRPEETLWRRVVPIHGPRHVPVVFRSASTFEAVSIPMSDYQIPTPPLAAYTLLLDESLACPPRVYGLNKFPDWELRRGGLDWGPHWIPAVRHGREDPLLSRILRGFQAAFALPHLRIRDFGETDLSLWAGLESEAPFWIGSPSGSFAAAGLSLDGTVLSFPSVVTSERFWGEDSGPRLLIEGGRVFGRHFEARLLSGLSSLSGVSDSVGRPWIRRAPTEAFPYTGAWLPVQAWTNGPLAVPQLSTGNGYDFVFRGQDPQTVLAAGVPGFPALTFGKKYPADNPLIARGTPSRSLVPLDPMPRNPAESHAARLLRVSALLSARDAPLGLRLSALLGRAVLGLSGRACGSAPFFVRTATYKPAPGVDSALLTADPLPLRPPGTFFGADSGAPSALSLLSPFRTSGLPGNNRGLLPLPSDGDLPDADSTDACLLSLPGLESFTLTSLRVGPDPAQRPFLRLVAALPVLASGVVDGAQRGGGKRTPGDAELRGDRSRALWKTSGGRGRSVPLDLLPPSTPSVAPNYVDALARFV